MSDPKVMLELVQLPRRTYALTTPRRSWGVYVQVHGPAWLLPLIAPWIIAVTK